MQIPVSLLVSVESGMLPGDLTDTGEIGT
jgi:hypothetical protein